MNTLIDTTKGAKVTGLYPIPTSDKGVDDTLIKHGVNCLIRVLMKLERQITEISPTRK